MTTAKSLAGAFVCLFVLSFGAGPAEAIAFNGAASRNIAEIDQPAVTTVEYVSQRELRRRRAAKARARRIMRQARRKAAKQRADRARWLKARARNPNLTESQYKRFRKQQIQKRRQLRARSRCRVKRIGNLICTVCQPGKRMACRALRKSAKVRKLHRRIQRAKKAYRRAKEVCRTVRKCYPATAVHGAFCQDEVVCK